MRREPESHRDRPATAPLVALARIDRFPPLPRPLGPLIGREREQEAARSLLLRPDVRLVTLTGAGGVGKTRLALEVAHDVAGEFADGVVFVELAAIRDAALVVPALARALGVRDLGDRPLIDGATSFLRDKVLLLVLDNFEHIAAAAAGVADFLAVCPDVKALVTSRVRLRIGGERTLPVPPLDLADPHAAPSVDRVLDAGAVRFFVERARAAVPSFEITKSSAAVAGEICRRLDGLPLAIELAAARLTHLGPHALLERLDRRLPLLTQAAADAPDRHRTMRDAIAWSYDLLSREEQTTLRRLSVFAGGCTLDAAEAVCAGREAGDGSRELDDRFPLAPDSVLDRLGALVEASLVRFEPAAPGGPRYLLLETIREFAAEQLAESGEETAGRDAHAAFAVALAEQAKPALETPAAAAWVARLEAEHGNVRAALAWLDGTGRRHDLLRLAYAMANFWGISLRLREARAWLERALDPARAAAAPPPLRAGAARGLGWIALCLGDTATAEAWLEEALAIRRRLGDGLGVAHTLTVLGNVAEYRGDDAGAQAWYAEALDGFRAVGHLPGIAWSLVSQADAAHSRGDAGAAARLAEEAVAVARESGHQHQLADALVALGHAASDRADWAAAIASLREALGLGRGLGSRVVCASALVGLAEVAVAAGEAGQAARLLGATVGLTEAGGLASSDHRIRHDRSLAAARGALDEPSFAAAWAAGRALGLEEAIDEGLAVAAPAAEAPANPLSPREREVLRLLAAGYSNRAIAAALFISPETVKVHVRSVLAKLGVESRVAAVAHALREGLA
jgi:non-specific serine/threonine protein kinase